MNHNRLTTLLYAAGAVLVLGAGMTAGAKDAVRLDPQGTGLSRMELDIWQDPEFQRRFAESYIAETEIEPRITVTERETMQEVLDFMSAEQIDEATKLLQKNRNEASTAVFDFTLANIFFQQDLYDEAAAVYQVAVDKYPKFLRAWKNLGLIYVRRGEYAKALPALTKVVELGGSDAVTYGLLGYAYANEENYLSAESAYRMAILLDPDTLDWKMGLARAFFKQERYAEAVAITRQLVESNPDRADLWLLQANAYIGMGKPLEAAEIYELVDQLGQSSVASLNMLGDIYINEELYELATQAYVRAMEKEPDNQPDRAIRAAKVLAARGAFDETRTLIERIAAFYRDRLEPEEQKDLLKLRARLAVADGTAEEEVQVLKEIVALDPLDGEALILLGQHAGRNDDPARAAFYFERAANIEGFEAKAKVRHAQLLVRQGEYADALPLLRRAQQIDPRDDIQEFLEKVERVAKAH